MENAAKALTMAGTILISIIVISALVFAFRELTGWKGVEADNQQVEEIAKFNKSYESYEKTLYGSELLSLANKMSDYNKRIGGKDGYEEMELEVTTKDAETKDIKYYTGIIEEEERVIKKYKSAGNLEALYQTYNNKDEDKNETAKDQKDKILEKINIKETLTTKNEVYVDYTNYKKYSELKKKKFKSNETEYSENGRIKKMTYEEE